MTPDPVPPLAAAKPKRRPRYSGTHPRRFDEKYKELNPNKYPSTIQKVMASGKTPAGMHRPVMLAEVMQVLKPTAGEIGVDCTLGYGGHTRELWKHIQPDGRLLVIDTDPIELPRTEARLREELNPGDRLAVHLSNFAGLSKVLGTHGLTGVDFLLADLGVSSMQLDDPGRGFSFKNEGPLDLRMNPKKGSPASLLLQKLNVTQLAEMLRENADEPRADLIAQGLVKALARQTILTTAQLVESIRGLLQAPPLRLGEDEVANAVQRVFQALRIAVNEEFNALEMLLRQLPQCLNPEGRVAILTFHSGEDRRVKQAFEKGWKTGFYSSIAEEVIRPTADERYTNPRASCAKLRWAIRSPRASSCMPDGEVPSVPQDHAMVEFRNSAIHGRGGFARVEIPSGQRIIEYLGERITKAESLRRCIANNEYVFTLDDQSDLDGDVSWNPARLINHSCAPNCEAIHEDDHIWIFSLRPIQPGEELSFNYGFDLDSYKEYPCRCGSAKCVGFIVAEEFHEHVRNLNPRNVG